MRAADQRKDATVDEKTVPTPSQSEQPTQPRAARKPYTPPAIVSETRLETRAGSPFSNPLDVDPINSRNDYGL